MLGTFMNIFPEISRTNPSYRSLDNVACLLDWGCDRQLIEAITFLLFRQSSKNQMYAEAIEE